VVLEKPDKSIVEVPCGLVIWAAGNKGRKLTQDLMAKLPEQTNRRGIIVDGTSTSSPRVSLMLPSSSPDRRQSSNPRHF